MRQSEKRAAAAREGASAMSGKAGRAAKAAMSEALESAGMDPRVAKAMADGAYALPRDRIAPPPPPEEEEWAALPEEDEEALARMSPGLSPDAQALLRAMLVTVRTRPHPSGRIRYDDVGLAGLARLKRAAYLAAFAELAGNGLVRCAVVGSKEPVQTIELPWDARGEGA